MQSPPKNGTKLDSRFISLDSTRLVELRHLAFLSQEQLAEKAQLKAALRNNISTTECFGLS